MEQLDYNLLYRWFVGLTPDVAVWVPTVFTKNRDRLLDGNIAEAFFNQELVVANEHRLLSHEHFTVDGTLLEAWASQKSIRPVERADGEPAWAHRASGCPTAGHHAACCAERPPPPAPQRNRSPHDAPRRLRDQSAQGQAGVRGLRLSEMRGAVAQAPLSRHGDGRLDLHLHHGGVQSRPIALAPHAHTGVAARRRGPCAPNERR